MATTEIVRRLALALAAIVWLLALSAAWPVFLDAWQEPGYRRAEHTACCEAQPGDWW